MVIDLPPDLPLIHVDPVLVQQALVQIFDNSVKYSAPESQIAVTARTHDSKLIISIGDQGTGLTAAEKTKIWDRFARGERHAATTSGSGLGLWIASAFVGANDGKVSAASEGPGLGTTVAVELPVALAAVPQLESGVDE
jgi:two-component system sensor histidine kinase KdpD